MSKIDHRLDGRVGAEKGGAYSRFPLKPARADRSRTALLAGASLIALAAFAAPVAAYACSGADQTITNLVHGTVESTGGSIKVTAGGAIFGNNNGVFAVSCSVTTLGNEGLIAGAAETSSIPAGSGVLVNSGVTIALINNGAFGTIEGGTGIQSWGVANGGTITTLTNNGAISGGFGASGFAVLNGGTITTLTNHGAISGGSGNAGGASGIFNEGTITTLTNSGTIGGGAAGTVAGAPGGAGVGNSGTITSLTNSGTIAGGSGGEGGTHANGGGLGEGVFSEGDIKTLINSGTISGGQGAAGGWGGKGVLATQIESLNNETGGAIIGGAGGAGSVGGDGGAGIEDNGGVFSAPSNIGNIAGGMIIGGAGGASSGAGAVGGAGGAGISNLGFTRIPGSGSKIGTLTNSGMISGGQGGSGDRGGAGGAGVSNLPTATMTQLNNQNGGTVVGGAGGSGLATGGAGLSNAGTIGSSHIFGSGLNNQGMILGGLGGSSAGAGGAGVANSGSIRTLSNSGTIRGGEGGRGVTGGVGGAGVSNSGTIGTLTNSATISGGRGGTGGGQGASGGAGGAGVSNSGTIGTLTNSGTISGGAGGFGAVPGAGGTGVRNSGAGTIGTLTNIGTISGGAYAIYSPGVDSIGSFNNTGGQTIGNVLVDPSAPFLITGGSGKTFGVLKGGTITVVGGDLVFKGNTELADNIKVNGGRGTVTNDGVLRLATPETITGNFKQMASGVLDFLLAGDAFGQYGALTVTGGALLDGELALNPVDGFHLMGGDAFDLMTFSPDGGAFTGVSLNGVACSATLSTVWDCGKTGFNLDVAIGLDGVDVTVASIPEPSTWAMLATGFLGLAAFGLCARRRAQTCD
jgi:hypothetical protein